MSSRPSESLLAASQALRAATDANAIHDALRDTARAIEYHLDTLSGQLRPGGAGLEPRFRPAALRIQAELQEVLSGCWAIERSLVVDGSPGDKAIERLVAVLRGVGGEELDLVFDSLNATGGVG